MDIARGIRKKIKRETGITGKIIKRKTGKFKKKGRKNITRN